MANLPTPSFCYGTAWKQERTAELTALALRCGFRAIDTANQRKHYDEAGVGAAIAQAEIPRDQLFLQSKFTHIGGQDHRLPYDPAVPIRSQVEQSFTSSLAHLNTTYLDSYLLHGPSSRTDLADQDIEAWRALETIYASERTRMIGISNVSVGQLERLCQIARVAPAVVQNRCYANTGWDAEIRTYCRRHGIAYQGFSLLTANRHELQRPIVDQIMARTGRSREQLVFQFAIQSGITPLTGTSSERHMREDLEATAIGLDVADLGAIESIAI